MDWFADFYETDYFHYRYAPRLDEVPRREVDFILAEGLPEGSRPEGRAARVFDICCGVGRHARPLAAAGCEVIGVDLSNPNIEAADDLARRDGLAERCRFIQGDIRRYAPPADRDLAINIFTSFGYFENEQADSIIFRKAAESLRPGGRFILDVNNRERLVAHPPKIEKRGDENNYVIDESRLDLTDSRLTCTWTFVRDGETREHTIRIRLYCLHELIALGKQFDLEYVKAFGDFDGSAYGGESRRCITVFTKR
jgi:SAM-dependent methyltransferase